MVLNKYEPTGINLLWIKPTPNGAAAYVQDNGAFQPLVLMDGKGTPSVHDDTVIDISGGGGQSIEPVETASAMWDN